ncbi:SMR family transporter [Tropicimonas sp. IMCC34043]|uniref:SMR family transporter n=1 Tax=Tropicimonas sp. IMCC34043 TaxID=2248760 RepID=UPI000E22257C|nr:SMR family transporter [Tropicimonas sp. IMCC34043]
MFSIDMLTARPTMAIAAAAGYALATLFMKLAADGNALWPIAGIVVALGVTVSAEIVLLRRLDLGIAYVVVIGVESLLVLAIACLVGEPLSHRDLLGGAMVIAGAAMVSH